jgi:hypothetical protein
MPAGAMAFGGGTARMTSSMTIFAGGPSAAGAQRMSISVNGQMPPEMQAQLDRMQAQQAEAAAKLRIVEYRITYDDYKTIDGVQVPMRFRRVIDGKPVEELTLDNVRINPKIDPAKFQVTRTGG